MDFWHNVNYIVKFTVPIYEMLQAAADTDTPWHVPSLICKM
jgi:hypothetical protein